MLDGRTLTVLDWMQQTWVSSSSCHAVLLIGTETTLVCDQSAWQQVQLMSSRPLTDMHLRLSCLLVQNWAKNTRHQMNRSYYLQYLTGCDFGVITSVSHTTYSKFCCWCVLNLTRPAVIYNASFFFFFQKTTQLQYIEDSEPSDGSTWSMACSVISNRSARNWGKQNQNNLKSGSSRYGCNSLHQLSVEHQDTG